MKKRHAGEDSPAVHVKRYTLYTGAAQFEHDKITPWQKYLKERAKSEGFSMLIRLFTCYFTHCITVHHTLMFACFSYVYVYLAHTIGSRTSKAPLLEYMYIAKKEVCCCTSIKFSVSG